MGHSPRAIAVRLNIAQLAPAQAAYRAIASARYFARGYRYGQQFPAPAASLSAPGEDPESALEAYANAHANRPEIFKWRHYFAIYERHLSRFRGTPLHLVEIGVAGGGSLEMWRDYLGPAAHICGIDIDPACARFAADRTEIVIGDQGDPTFWDSFIRSHPEIDVVIDDGGHLPEQQLVTLEKLLPGVRPGGVYICEDIHGPFQPFHAFLDGLTRPLNTIPTAEQASPANTLQRQIASVHRYPILTVIEKTSRDPAVFQAQRYGSTPPA